LFSKTHLLHKPEITTKTTGEYPLLTFFADFTRLGLRLDRGELRPGQHRTGLARVVARGEPYQLAGRQRWAAVAADPLAAVVKACGTANQATGSNNQDNHDEGCLHNPSCKNKKQD
jgi:hypothetical protein